MDGTLEYLARLGGDASFSLTREQWEVSLSPLTGGRRQSGWLQDGLTSLQLSLGRDPDSLSRCVLMHWTLGTCVSTGRFQSLIFMRVRDSHKLFAT